MSLRHTRLLRGLRADWPKVHPARNPDPIDTLLAHAVQRTIVVMKKRGIEPPPLGPFARALNAWLEAPPSLDGTKPC